MKRGFQWTAILMAGMMLLSGCKGGNEQGAVSFDYDEYLKQQQEKPVVWLYGDDSDIYSDYGMFGSAVKHCNYDMTDGMGEIIQVKQFSSADYDASQFQTKLKADIMSGKGPDIVVTRKSNGLFEDVNKAIEAGAFQSFDEMIKKWDKDTYYSQMIEGLRHTDGHIYMLPVSLDCKVIITTEQNLKNNGLTVEDFSDFSKTTDALLKLWEQYEPNQSPVPCYTLPMLSTAIPSIFDYQARSSSLCSEQTTALFAKWRQIMAYRKQAYLDNTGVYEMDGKRQFAIYSPNYGEILDGSKVLEITNFNACLRPVLYWEGNTPVYCTEEDMEQIICIPLYDTEGRWIIDEVDSYVLFPAHSKANEQMEQFLQTLLFDVDWVSVHQLSLSKKVSRDRVVGFKEGDDVIAWNDTDSASGDNGLASVGDINFLMQNPIKVHCVSEVQADFEVTLRKALSDGETDLSKLEKQLDIYLSE